jgi:hypothetical protein
MSTTDDIGTTAPNPDQIDPAMLVEVEQALDGAARPMDIPHPEAPRPATAQTVAKSQDDIPHAETTRP